MGAAIERTAVCAVGIDIVDVAEVEDSLERFGEHYLERVCTARERAAAPSSSGGALAAVFALKEAAFKALAPAEAPLNWRWIEVLGPGGGQPRIEFSGPYATLAQARGFVRVTGSVASQQGQALAIVLAERAAA